MKVKYTVGEQIFHAFVVLVTIFLSLAVIIPLMSIVFASFSDPFEVMKHSGIYWHPIKFSLYSYQMVFQDKSIITGYLNTYKLTPEELVTKMIEDVYKTTGITATAGIGTNMYLAKVAMDITAKHMKPNEFGVRMARLDEKSYRELLWDHTPLTDFWRVGSGYSKKLEANGMHTMGDVARMSLENEDKLFKLFGVMQNF